MTELVFRNDAPRMRRPPAIRILYIAAWSFVALLVLAGVAAALLPGYLKSLTIEQIRERLGRDATVESVAVNPFLLTVRVKGLSIHDRDGKSNLLKFDELYTRIGVRSIFFAAPVIEELRLAKPRIDLARLDTERYNISDIVDRLLAGPSATGQQGPRFELNSLAVTDGEIVFDDRPAGAVHRIEKLTISLPMLSSFEADRREFSEPSISAIVNGRPLEVKGRTKPFDESLETMIDLHLSNVDLPRYLAYSPVPLPVRLDEGNLSTALDIKIVRAKNRTLSVTAKGTLRVDDLLLRDAAAGAASEGPVAALRRLDVSVGELKWPDNTLKLNTVAIDAPQLWLVRAKNGTINWQEIAARMTPPPVVATAADAAHPFRFAIDDLRVTDGLVLYEDLAAPSAAFKVVASPIVIHARNVSNTEGQQAAIDASLVTDGNEELTHAGTLSLAPLVASGEVSLKRVRVNRYHPYFGNVLVADVDGLVDVDGRYALGGDGKLKVAELRVNGTGILVKDAGRTELVRVGSATLADGELDLNQKTMAIGSVTLRQCRAFVVRDAGGRLNLESLVTPANDGRRSAGKPPAPIAASLSATATTASSNDWVVSVKQANVERCALRFDDLAAAKGASARIVLDPLDARVDNWSTRPANRARIDVRTKVNGNGHVAMKGAAGTSPLGAELDVAIDALDLVPLQPYVADRLNIRVSSGALSTRGKLSVSQPTAAAPMAIRYAGQAGIAGLKSTTKADGEDFLNWESLRATGLDIGVNAAGPGGSPVPLAVALDEVALSNFYSRLIVNADGTLNVQHVARAAGEDAAASSAAAVGMTAAAPTQSGAASLAAVVQAGAPMSPQPSSARGPSGPNATAAPITIGKVTLASGRIDFSDRFIKPNYSANINAVAGAVTGLSSDFASRANVDIKGRYDPSAPVEIKGTINPLRGNLYLDIAASCRDVELVPFTPYAQKYAGYGITRGKLSLKVKYVIDDRKLTAENSLRLDQLTFGDKVESPDATKLPVLFALALLKNSKGEIDLDLPVSGSLDDPQFSVFGIVVKIIVNLLVKVATSPFALLGALAGGGGEDLAYVEFAPGVSAMPASGQEEKLSKIATALTERPALKLDIAGFSDVAADSDALRRRALSRRVATALQEERIGRGEVGGSIGAMTVPPGEYPRLLKRVFDSERSARPTSVATSANSAAATATSAAPASEPSPTEMETLLLAAIAVGDDDLRELAEARARSTKEYLSGAGIVGERMFIVAGGPPPKGTEGKRGPRVEFALK